MDDKNGSLAALKSERASLRPPMRPDDPRAAAAERAKQIMEHIGEFGEQAGDFDFDPSIVPDGWSYEWKVHTVMGAIDPSRQIELARMGWEPVPASRHPEMMPGETKEKIILRKGMQLMERPLEITERARAHADKAAKMQMRSKKEQLEGGPVGAFESNNKGKPLSKIKSDFSLSMAVPD